MRHKPCGGCEQFTSASCCYSCRAQSEFAESFKGPGGGTLDSGLMSKGWECYAVLYGENGRERATHDLGPNPWMSSVVAHLTAHPGDWSNGSFRLTYGGSCGPGDGRAFVQAHVIESGHGMTVKQFLTMQTHGVRLGASAGRATANGGPGDGAGVPPNQQAADVRMEIHRVAPRVEQEAFRLNIGEPILRRKILVSAVLTDGPGMVNRMVMSPMTIPFINRLSKMFESVRLVDAAFILTVSKGSGTVGAVAFGRQNFPAGDLGAVRGRPHSLICHGADGQVTRHLWDLPARHNFSREYNMATLGNPNGHVTFLISGDSGSEMTIDGYLDMEFSGEGVVDPIRLRPVASVRGQSLRRDVRGAGPSSLPAAAANPSPKRRIEGEIENEESAEEDDNDDETQVDSD